MSSSQDANFSTNASEKASSSDINLGLDSVMGILFMVFYVTVVLASLVGNSLVLIVCYRSLRGRRGFESAKGPFFNHYIANLAIADLLFTLLTTFDALYAILGEWITGDVTCKLQGFLLETCYTASILTLVAISRERCSAISTTEINSRIQRGKERKTVTSIVWFATVIICSPLLFAYSTKASHQNVMRCRNINWGYVGRRVYYSLAAVLFFIFPLFFMVWTHVRINKVLKSQVAPTERMLKSIRVRQKKASRMLAMVTLMFFMFWSPLIVLRTLRYFAWYEGIGPWKFAQLLLIASSATNPFVYCFYSTQFRRYFKTIITCRCARFVQSNESIEGTSLSNSQAVG